MQQCFVLQMLDYCINSDIIDIKIIMNEILRKTHIKKNIDLLKARDVFFDNARRRNKWFKMTIIMPPLIASLTYLPFVIQIFPFVEGYRDFIIGIFTVLFVIIGEYIQKKNSNDIGISNALREEYDLEVFGIDRNEFAFDESVLKNDTGQYLDKIVKAWESRPDLPKYEVWYQEVFGDDKRSNILCLQLDNIIYTYYIYTEYKNCLKVNMIIGIILMSILFLISVFVWGNASVFILIMFSLFGALQSQIADYKLINDLISANLYSYQYVLDNSKEIKIKLADEKKGQEFLRSLQNVVIVNRERSLFVPKRIRDKFLINGNPFYQQLDNIKREYLVNPYVPIKAEDIDVLSSSGEVTTNLKEVHSRLLTMIKDVDREYREAGIYYMLDGGSLIGACRDEKGFVFWDDDIDISLMNEDVEKAKQVIKEKLGNKYDIQDYYNDDYYSPRLSTFRIREKNERSKIEEKDSELCYEYNNKGIFIDVYAYSPIVVNKTVDGFIRKLLIQGFNIGPFKGLYNSIRKEERDWKYDLDSNREKHFKKYLKLKRKYLDRVKLYLRLANCKDYYAYVPNYIDNIKKTGPYVSQSALVGRELCECDFEDMKAIVPANSDEVLTNTYGNWKESPFKSLNELKTDNGYEFSRKKFDVTCLKHIKYINEF